MSTASSDVSENLNSANDAGRVPGSTVDMQLCQFS